MRPISLIAALLLVGCDEERAVVISELGEGEVAACEPLAGPETAPVSVTQLQPVSDSTFLLVDQEAREVTLLDADARALRRWAFTREGPLGVAQLMDAVLKHDTLLVVDAGRLRVRAFGPALGELWAIDTPFPVQRIAAAGHRTLVAAIGLDPRIPGLLHEVAGASLRPLGVPFASHEDALVRMFVNAVTLQGYPDGSVIAAQQFVSPTAWRVEVGGAVRRLSTPVAAATAAVAGWTPPVPFTDEDLKRLAAPVIASAPEPRSGHLFYLTRTGRLRDGWSEKALVRVDRDFRYQSSVVLSLNAVALAYLPVRPDSAIVVDFEQGWHRCPLP